MPHLALPAGATRGRRRPCTPAHRPSRLSPPSGAHTPGPSAAPDQAPAGQVRLSMQAMVHAALRQMTSSKGHPCIPPIPSLWLTCAPCAAHAWAYLCGHEATFSGHQPHPHAKRLSPCTHPYAINILAEPAAVQHGPPGMYKYHLPARNINFPLASSDQAWLFLSPSGRPSPGTEGRALA